MIDPKRLIASLEEAGEFQSLPGLETWERGYRAGLIVAAQIVRSADLTALAKAGNLADLADAETAYEGWTEAERMYERG